MKIAILWFRKDLRTDDNPALLAAVKSGYSVLPVFIDDTSGPHDWPAGSASRWWLHFSLKRLNRQLKERGNRLILKKGNTREILEEFCHDHDVAAIYWNRRYESAIVQRDSALKSLFKKSGIECRSFNGSLIFEPWEVATGGGHPYRVYTPFSKAVAKLSPIGPQIAPAEIPAPRNFPRSVNLNDLNLLPAIPWDTEFYARWNPERWDADSELKRFLDQSINAYKDRRDIPSERGTSRLSPALHWGDISARRVYFEANKLSPSVGRDCFLREIVWREFAYHVLYHFPKTPELPLQPKFNDFPWERDSKMLHAWQRGLTGYPIVDAGMRELWQTGWMHNRIRMVVASFLVKHLLQPWQDGALWFWDTLVDADLASNTLGWQWAGGCGADAAPYFRIFNPIIQGQKFDPKGDYTKRFVPELKNLPEKYLHSPWEAPDAVLRKAGITLGENYPKPIVDHKTGRARALKALEKIKQ